MLKYVVIKFYFNRQVEMQMLGALKEVCWFLYKNICNFPRLQSVLKIGESIFPSQLINSMFLPVFIVILFLG